MVRSHPAHTPYDGSSKPFTIGLRPLDVARWIEMDERLPAYLGEKNRHFAEHPERVFVAEEGTADAGGEVLALALAHLTENFPQTYRRQGDLIEIAGMNQPVDLVSPGRHPLHTASLLVAEDLVLMRRGEDGWRLAAASLCFPSSWSLAEKFGRPLPDIHRPVPGLGHGSRMETLIARIFDNLKVDQPVERLNWSLQENADLHRPLSHNARLGRQERGGEKAGEEGLFIRVERQTLRRLPASGDILFTIRIHVDPVAALATHPDRATIAASFAEQIKTLSEEQTGYKGLASMRDEMIETLRAMERG